MSSASCPSSGSRRCWLGSWPPASRRACGRIAERHRLARALRCNRKCDPWKDRRLQQCDEFISVHLAVAEDCRQQARADDLTGVDRYNGSAAVGMTKEVMTALDSRDFEPCLPPSRDDLSPRDPWKASHATVIFWTPMKSSGSTLSPWTSRQSSTASRTLTLNSSRDVACV